MNTQNTQNCILFQWSSDYAQMTRQQRRAYERRLAKENNRKH